MAKIETEEERSVARIMPGDWASIRGTRPPPAKPDGRRAAIYSRYSTAGQKETSIERQIEICAEYVVRTDREVCGKYADRARGGTTTVGRDGLEEMVRDARAGLFGVLVIENVDRLARDLGIASTVFKTLQRCGVPVHVPGRGQLTITDLAVQALMGDEGRRVLGEHTRFAINEMAREGRFPTGACLGYVPVPGSPGVCAIDQEAANWVRRAFGLRADGLSYKSIARIMQAEGARSRRGGRIPAKVWRATLANARYVGILIHNRYAHLKDPETGLKTVHLRPRSEWIVASVPECRIVDQETWDRVRAVDAGRRSTTDHSNDDRATYLLSGRVMCPACGIRMSVARTKDHRYWFCRNHAANGFCPHGRGYPVEGLDKAVLDIVGEELSRPGFMQAYADAYNEERGRADVSHADRRGELRRRVAELTRKVDRTLDEAFAEGISQRRIADRRRRLEAELDEAEAQLALVPHRPPTLGLDEPRMTALRDAVGTLSGHGVFRLKAGDEAGLRVAAALREIVRRVDVEYLGRSRFTASVTLGFGPLVGLEGDGPGESATRVVTRSCLRHRGGYHVHECHAAAEPEAAAVEPMIADEDWAGIRNLLPANASMLHGKPGLDPRPFAEALFRVILTGATWNGQKKALSVRGDLRYHAVRMLRAPDWETSACALAARYPERFGDLPELSRPYVAWAGGSRGT